MEAYAAAPGELKLRTVVQFYKVNDVSSRRCQLVVFNGLQCQVVDPDSGTPDWRTVIWLSIDHPVTSSSASWRYTNGDVNTLPWSYTFSPLPDLLNYGADAPMSKYYTVPSTTSTPYPTLPIDLPDMAMYLHAALAESRRAMHDSSSGVRRLAKMVDLCYPELASDDRESDTERKGVSGLFKRVIGRNKNKKEGRGNEDTYDLVTPFVCNT